MTDVARRDQRRQSVWVALYGGLIALPIVLLVPGPSYGSFSATLAVGIGFAAYMTMVLQCVTASRLDLITAPFGSDVLIRFHRYAGMFVTAAIVVHLAVLFIYQSWARAWFWPPTAPLEGLMGLLASVCVLTIAATSIRRPRWLGYEGWRRLHFSLTVVAVISIYIHALRASTYSSFVPVRTVVIGSFVVALGALLLLRVARTIGSLRHPYAIRELRQEGQDVTTVVLEPVGGRSVHFAPGQFAWLKFGDASYTFTEHPFTIASSALRRDSLEFSIKALGDRTGAVPSLTPGTRVLVDGPHGDPVFPRPDAGFVCVVGGIGITPAMSIIRTLADSGDQRPVDLIYGVRGEQDVPFDAELAQLAQRCRLTVHLVVSDPSPAWTGQRGFIDHACLAALLPHDARGRNVLVCGPPIMSDGVARHLEALGVPRAVTRVEGFSLA